MCYWILIRFFGLRLEFETLVSAKGEGTHCIDCRLLQTVNRLSVSVQRPVSSSLYWTL